MSTLNWTLTLLIVGALYILGLYKDRITVGLYKDRITVGLYKDRITEGIGI